MTHFPVVKQPERTFNPTRKLVQRIQKKTKKTKIFFSYLLIYGEIITKVKLFSSTQRSEEMSEGTLTSEFSRQSWCSHINN